VSAIAVERPRAARAATARSGALGVVRLVVGVAALWGLWEGYRWLGIRGHWTWPFTVDDTTMPHIHRIFAAFDKPLQPEGPPLRHYEWHYALFTGKEALAGFGLGASIGFALAVVLAHSNLLRRGFLPYIVMSQTVPILAIAPMVVVGLGQKGVQPWVAVAVIAAYLTFFPVAINTLRGLHSPDPRALELMRSYAAGRWKILWRLRVPASLPFVFSALKISATASVIGAIIGETPASLQGGLGYAIVNFNQYYTIQPANLWATILVCAALGIAFFLAVVVVERIVLKRAPEHVA
jgi:NitT/TauT family transport system permease protein